MVAWNKGRKLSEEHKRKISKTLKGRKKPLRSLEYRKNISKSKIGSKNPNYGKHLLKETKEKMSKVHEGKNNNQWKGGISFEPYSFEFNNKLKQEIRERDNYRCQQCFRHQEELYTNLGRKYKLLIHHIDYDKKNNKSNNLISLCRTCHNQTNFKRENWVEYFRKKVI